MVLIRVNDKCLMFCFHVGQTTTITCEDYSDLCTYEMENFRIACFGDCNRTNAMDESPIDMERLYEECGEEAQFTDRYQPSMILLSFVAIISLNV